MSKTEYIQQYLQSGYRLFKVNGKIPAQKGWQNTKENPFLSAKDFPKNYGVCLRADDLVIDIDIGENKDGTEKQGKQSFKKLTGIINFDFESTFGVKTGAGGFHFYFKKPKDLKIKEKWSQYPDIEFKSKGRYVVGAGSIHPQTQKTYNIVVGGINDVQKAPTALLKIIEYEPVDFSKTPGLNRYADDTQSIARCKAFLERAEPAIEGQGGDQSTYVMACRCRSFGLSPQTALELLLAVWNPKCEPEWDADELKIKVFNAYQYDERPLGQKHPETDFKGVTAKKTYVWITAPKKDGTHIPNLKHAVNYMDINETLRGLFKYNLFTEEIEFTRRPIWYPPDRPLAAWTDNDAIACKFHLATYNKFDAGVAIINEAAFIHGNNNPYHPLKDYLNKLVWDKKFRIDTWLSTYADIKNDKYTRTIGTKTLLAAIARIFDPGCKFDSVLVLEGKQGVGKSRLVAALGGKWYGDLYLDPHNKDTVAAMRNKWIIEISEMETVRKADINAMKAFLSRQTDRHRLSHRRNAEDYPRQCIFIGTINPDQGGGYLRDTTGNRRFWPVEIPKKAKVKVEKMHEDVDQIWAEAVHRYKKGDTNLHIEDEAISFLAEEEAEKRRPKDPWLDIIKEWLRLPDEIGRVRKKLSSIEIFTDCLNGVVRNFNRTEQTRITQIMVNEIGWDKGCFYCSKKKATVAGFNRPKNDVNLL